MIRHRFHPSATDRGILELSFGHRWIVINGLLEKVGTDDSDVADFSPVDQFRMADYIASVAGAVAAKIAEEKFVGSTSGSSRRARRVVGDPLGQLEKLQTGQR